jgi:peptidoglycan/LPS O-acetylase OafA/YrhL
VRGVLGVLIGAAVWTIGFYALATALAQLWPDYAIHARQWLKEGTFTFTPPMACCNLALWALAEAGAGWVTARISRRRAAVWALAGLIAIYLAVIHIVMSWPLFPWWYNLGVVIPAVPAVLLGASLASPAGADA